jgi:hypothetical protein
VAPAPNPEALRPVLIEVAHADSRGFFYYRLTSANYDSLYSLLYLQAATADRTTIDPPALCELFRLSGAEGRELASTFWALDLSWNPHDYWIRLQQIREYSPHAYEEHCGAITYADRNLFACPVWAGASGKQSADANKLAWFISRLERARERNAPSGQHEECREQAAYALHALFERLPHDLRLRVYRGPKQKFRILSEPLDVGDRLRDWTSAALVNAELVADPIGDPNPLVRKHATAWYGAVWPERNARSALLRGLQDHEPDIRALAGETLASVVEPDDAEAIRALRQLLETDKDHPVVREWLVDTLRSRGLLNHPGTETH